LTMEQPAAVAQLLLDWLLLARVQLLAERPGQGAQAQHTPQPLQAWPAAGMAGASDRSRMTRGRTGLRESTEAFFALRGDLSGK
ncbi:MAG: hypothetical protein J0M20_17040, partial [Burkholderiales bacterium]|nr:hypothetical protein [Burkholderiales bacterium]